jgi:hypothetical protein
MKKTDRATIETYLVAKYDYCGNPLKMRIAKDGAVSIIVDNMPNTNQEGRIFAGWDTELLREAKA